MELWSSYDLGTESEGSSSPSVPNHIERGSVNSPCERPSAIFLVLWSSGDVRTVTFLSIVHGKNLKAILVPLVIVINPRVIVLLILVKG